MRLGEAGPVDSARLSGGAGELASAFTDARQLAGVGELFAGRHARWGRRGIVCAVVAVVDDDPFCVAVLGARPRGELGLGGIAML